jgi:hypothetical protein
MITTLSAQRCFNHAEREAVARCPGCRHFYCRECVTEHDDQVICAECLRRLAAAPSVQRVGWVKTFAVFRCLAGFIIAWFFFYLIGESLLAMPSSFHEGSLWQVKWWHEK